MEVKRIEHMDTWAVVKEIIIEKGYKFWQSQYNWNEPEGYHAGFMRGDKRLEIITHNKEIAEDIIHNM